MSRWQRISVGLLAAYAGSMTLLAAKWGAQLSILHMFFGGLPGIFPVEYARYQNIFHDCGIPLVSWKTGMLLVATIETPTLAAMIGVIFIGGLAVGSLRRPRHSQQY
jgi:hypothetical protein